MAGVVQLEQSMYLAPRLNWVGNIAGGLIFGVGMVLAGGCPSRNLARAGGGDLRALLTMIVLGARCLHDHRRPHCAGAGSTRERNGPEPRHLPPPKASATCSRP